MILPSHLRWLWLTLAVILADRATKAWFETQTQEGWRRELIHNFIYLVHSRNSGIAFGVFSDMNSPWVRIALIAGSVLVIGALAWLFVVGQSGGSSVAAGLALLLGGATGNVTDRIIHGAVTDSPHSSSWMSSSLGNRSCTQLPRTRASRVRLASTMLDYLAIHALPILFHSQSGREPLLQLLRFATRPELRADRDGDDTLISSASP